MNENENIITVVLLVLSFGYLGLGFGQIQQIK